MTAAASVPPFARFLRLVSIDPTRNRARFFTLQWQPTLWEERALVCVWGRLHTPGQMRVLVSATAPDLEVVVRRIVRRRLLHGYQVVAWQ